MVLPLPQFQSLGQMIADRLEQGNRNALLGEELKSRKFENEFSPQRNKMQMQKMEQENQLFPLELQRQQLNNKLLALKEQMSVPQSQAELHRLNSQIAQAESQTKRMNQLFPSELEESKLRPDLLRAQISNANELAKNRSLGISGLGTGAREELFYQNLVAKDNPQLQSDQQVREASNVYAQGGNQLSDGTKLNPISNDTRRALDRLTLGSTTSGAVTPTILSAQSEAEIEELSKFAQEGLAPYGTTYFNYSPEQIMDSFKSDEKSQKKLGKFIAAQQINYEIAQNEIKQAMGQPGVGSTRELIHSGSQTINAQYPKLSYTARKEANEYFIKALKAAQNARKTVGVSPSRALENKEIGKNEKKILKYNLATGRLE